MVNVANIRMHYKLFPGGPSIHALSSVTGQVGTVLSIPFSTSTADPVTFSLAGADAALFAIVNGAVVLSDSSTVGGYSVTLVATNTATGLFSSKNLTFTVTSAASLPTLTLSASAADANTIQCTFSNNAAFVSYEAAIDGDYGLGRIPLPSNKQIGTRTPGADYDVQVRGVASNGSTGPWSNTVNVVMPTDNTGIGSGTTADQADHFVESIGINLHLNYSTGIWLAANSSVWLPRLKTCGIRYARTSFGGSAQANSYIADLFSSCGMKFLLVLHALTNKVFDTTKLNNWLNTAENTIGASKIVGFDGPNEVNNGWDGVAGHSSNIVTGDWAQNTVTFLAAMQANIRGRSAFNSIPIGGPSIWGRSTTAIDYVMTKNAGRGWAPYVDMQPIHIYTGGRRPTVGGVPLDSNQNGDPNAETTLQFTIADHARLVQSDPAKPTFVGEEGYDTVSVFAPSYPAKFDVISEVAQSKYQIRALAENYLNGVDKTYIYAWLNNNDATNWNALLNQSKDASAPSSITSGTTNLGPPYSTTIRSALTNVENLITIMADAGSPFTPGALTYSLTGAGATSDVHHKLFQKRNGHFFLMIWYDGISWKRSSPVGDVASLTAAVTLHLPSNPTNVKYYTPYTGTSSTGLGGGTSFDLTVPDHLMILEITP